MRLGAAAGERSRTVPTLGTLALRPGARIDDDPLRVALFLGVVLGLDPEPSHVAPMIPS